MRIEELKKSLESGFSPVYVVEGDDAYLRELALRNLKNKCLGDSDIDFCSFEGSEIKANPEILTSALIQYPFLSPKRLICVRDYAPSATDLKNKALSEYFSNPSDFSVLVIINSVPCENLKKIACAEVVDCSKASASVLERYVRVSLKRLNVFISEQNARLLAEYCLNDMTRLSGEVEKLAAYCAEKGEVTASDIENLVTRDTDYRIYEMTDNLAQKRVNEALDILNDMLQKNSEPQKLYTSVYYYFRRLFFCAVSDKSTAQLARELGVKEYAASKSVALAKKIGARKLKNTVSSFEKFDSDFKSGKLSINDALFICVFKILVD